MDDNPTPEMGTPETSADGGEGQTQQLPRDNTRLMPSKKTTAPKMHPALKAASQSWQQLHGAKFHANAMSKKKK